MFRTPNSAWYLDALLIPPSNSFSGQEHEFRGAGFVSLALGKPYNVQKPSVMKGLVSAVCFREPAGFLKSSG